MHRMRSPLALAVAAAAVVTVAAACTPPPPPPPPPTGAPSLSIAPIVTGLSQPWDVDWLPDTTPVFTQRTSGLFALKSGIPVPLTAGGADFWASGETGMMGVAVDPRFASNRRVYTCQGSTDNSPVGSHGNSVKVVAWELDAGVTAATKLFDVVTGIDATSGRHGGCRLEIDSSLAMWVTTGDAAFGRNPQDLSSLAGKVLKVSPDGTNVPAPGNPYAAWPFGDTRLIFTYGHRNVQGISFRSDGTVWTAEHGPSRDDEVNVLIAGQNYGWNPVPGYNEAVPMTDGANIPGAIFPQWASGAPTVAPSGMTFLSGAQWGPWDGALALAMLKESRLHIQFYASPGYRGEQIPAQFDGAFGRLRTAQQGPDGCLYVLTGNGTDDRILRVCPS